MKHISLPAFLFLVAAGVAAQAPKDRTVDALDGLDPVLLVQGTEVPGKSALSVERGRFTYLFSTAETKSTFEREPAKYEIQLGGLCARMGKTAGGNPSDFLVHDGKIYIFGSDECHKRFQASPEKYLEPASMPFPSERDATTRGRQLIEAAVRAIGAPARLDAVTSYVESVVQVQRRPDGDVPVSVKTMWRFPDSVRRERSMTRQGKTLSASTVVTPNGMWFIGNGGEVYPTLEAARPNQEQEFGRHPVPLLHARKIANFKAAALGPATVEGTKVQRVRVVNGAVDVIMNLDPEHRLHSISFTDRNNTDGQYGSLTLFYSDFRDVDGLKLPFSVRGLFDGQPDPTQTWTVESIVLNAPFDPSLFAPGTDGGK